MPSDSAAKRKSAGAYDRGRRESFAGRKLSLSSPPDEPLLTAEDEPVGAFEISRSKRITQVAIAIIYCLLAAGIVFGFAALKPILIDQGVYKGKCTDEELEDGVWVCYEQEIRLNLMFTVAAVSTNVCALPVGVVLDKFGPKVATFVGVFFLTLGTLLMAFADNISFDSLIAGYLFLALGGSFVFIPAFQLSNAFPQRSGLVLALLTGAFDTSSAVFLGQRLIYEGTNGSFTPKKFFLVYLLVPAFILVAQLAIMPGQSYKTAGEIASEDQNEDYNQGESAIAANAVDNHQQNHDPETDTTALLRTKSAENQAETEKRKADKSGVFGALHGLSAKQQIMSAWFLLITGFNMLQMLRINYFVATIRTQYTEMLQSYDQAVQINQFFDVALPLGGVIAAPFIGLLLDHTSTPFLLALLVSIATTIGVLGVIPYMWAAYAHVCLFVVYRPLHYTAVSDFSAKVFGFTTFGKVYGLEICLAGILNFMQAALDVSTHKIFDDDPVPVNVILASSALAVGIVLVGFVFRKSYTMQREKLEAEAERAREVHIPGADAERTDRPHGHQTYGTA